MSPADRRRRRPDRHGAHPDPAVKLLVLAGHHLSFEHADHGLDRRGGVAEARGLAGLADVPAGERADGHDSRENTVVVHDRHQIEVVVRHRQAHVPDRLAAVGDRKGLAHDVARPQHHVGQQLGRRSVAALEHPARLSIQIAQTHRHVLVGRVQPPLQLRVPDRRGDRVRVRIAVAGDVDQRQDQAPGSYLKDRFRRTR